MAIQTLSELFDLTTTKYDKPDHLIYRDKNNHLHKITTDEFRSRVISMALALRELGLNKGTKLLVLSENRPEWHIIDFAAYLLGVVIVPIFPTLIPDQIAYIIEHSECEVIAVSDAKHLKKIRENRSQFQQVRHVIVFEKADCDADSLAFEDLLSSGRELNDDAFYPQALSVVSPDDLASLIYTSGTTGTPKGVMLSHGNFISNMLDSEKLLDLTSADRGLSFLPLCHAFERLADYLYFYCGCSIVYCSGSDMVLHDMQETGPTMMASVPRFYEKVKTRIESKAEKDGGIRQAIFKWSMQVGNQSTHNRLNGRSDGLFLRAKQRLARKLVFDRIHKGVGGNLRYFISGGAPLSSEVAMFFLSAGFEILEGYGLTEASPIISGNSRQKIKLGTVGRLLDSVEARIAEDGEVLIRGPNIMLGYYKRPEETEAVIKDGWFYTGDIGVIDDEGFLTITDRKKQVIVTSVGKKVAPQPLEKEIENSKYVDQILLIGEKRNYITALIVPDFEILALHPDACGKNKAELVEDKKIIQLFQNEVDRRQHNFSTYERVQRFRLLDKPFTVENGQLTPTMKIKRLLVEKQYAGVIEAMYGN